MSRLSDGPFSGTVYRGLVRQGADAFACNPFREIASLSLHAVLAYPFKTHDVLNQSGIPFLEPGFQTLGGLSRSVASQKVGNGKILVQFRPMNPGSITDPEPISSFLFRSPKESWKPNQGYRKSSSIFQLQFEAVLQNRQKNGAWNRGVHCRRTHSLSPKSRIGCPTTGILSVKECLAQILGCLNKNQGALAPRSPKQESGGFRPPLA